MVAVRADLLAEEPLPTANHELYFVINAEGSVNAPANEPRRPVLRASTLVEAQSLMRVLNEAQDEGIQL